MKPRQLPSTRRVVQRRILCGIFLCLGLGNGVALSVEPVPHQPIQFNHKLHAGDLGIACETCHAGVEIRRRAGFPSNEVCGDCHVAPLGDSEEAAKLTELLENGTPLAWVQVTVIADHVLFSHQRHVALGNVGCVKCHGEMRERERPITAPAVDFEGRAGMLRCLGCHADSGSPYATRDCIDCHR
jgi:hypothetical protein